MIPFDHENEKKKSDSMREWRVGTEEKKKEEEWMKKGKEEEE